ncbi:MAG TPA: hypothetical protein VMW17_23925 [Candidatus Binatia bacterium]|nr:hypothetical protein [Candidatus Binatia bacterium]
MARRVTAYVFMTVALLLARPAWAPYHRMVIDQVFFGTPAATDAQFVQLRTLASGQIFVNNQSVRAEHGDGSSAGTFGVFAKNLTSTPAAGVRILMGTKRAEDLFCLAMDQIAGGALTAPDGRICFGLFTGPVTCLAYGDYAGDNTGFGHPAMAPDLGKALVRQNLSGHCAGGTNADNPCNADADCRSGSCAYDDNASDFAAGDPLPQNTTQQAGAIDGTPGDPDGIGTVRPEGIEHEVAVLFEADRRCDLTDPSRRGADANLDTRIDAADVTATVQIVAAAGPA